MKRNNSTNAELVKRIDAFLDDAVFKDHNRWDTPVEKQQFIAGPPYFNKNTGISGQPYEAGVMEVNVNLPADKFPQIQQQIAALDAPHAALPAQPRSSEH